MKSAVSPKTNLLRARGLLSIIPVTLFFFSQLLTDARGPYYLAQNSDPDYQYLFNSLSILLFHSPRHVDHPGTTVQILGAFVLFFKWLWGCLMGHTVPLQSDVLTHPEDFLRAIQFTVTILVALVVFLAGWKMYRLSGSLLAALAVQAPVFMFRQMLEALPRVGPEPLLMVAGFALLIPLIQLLLAEEGEEGLRPALSAGAVLGFGIVTKMTFFPWVLTAALFRQRKARIIFFLSALVAMVVLLLPILSLIPETLGFLFRMFTHTGQYGSGQSGFTTAADLTTHFKSQLDSEPYLIPWLVYYYLALAALYFGTRNSQGTAIPRLKILLWVGCLCMTMQLAMTLKHFAPHYILPSLAITGILNAFLVLTIASGQLRPWLRNALAICGVSLLVLTTTRTIRVMKDWTVMERQAAADVRELTTRRLALGDCLAIGYYKSSLPEFALEFGNGSTARVNAGFLEALHPKSITYNIWEKHFASYENERRDIEVWRMLQANQCVLMQGNGRDSLPAEFSLRPIVVQGGGRYGKESEIVYKLLSIPGPKMSNPQLSHPSRDVPLASSPVTFSWDPIPAAEDYWIDIGTSRGQGNLVATATGGAPFFTVDLSRYLDGRTLYVQIYSRFADVKVAPGTGTQYEFKTTSNHRSGNPLLSAPASGTVLTSSPVTFAWNAVPGALDYWIDVGTMPAKGDIFSGYTKGATRVTVDLTGHLTGKDVYVQLYAKIPGGSLSAGTGALYRFGTGAN